MRQSFNLYHFSIKRNLLSTLSYEFSTDNHKYYLYIFNIIGLKKFSESVLRVFQYIAYLPHHLSLVNKELPNGGLLQMCGGCYRFLMRLLVLRRVAIRLDYNQAVALSIHEGGYSSSFFAEILTMSTLIRIERNVFSATKSERLPIYRQFIIEAGYVLILCMYETRPLRY